MTKPASIRMVGIAMGDVNNLPGARVKYGHLFTAVSRHVQLVATIDAKLSGWERWLNGLVSFYPQRQRWQQRFYKNVLAFRQRSRQISTQLSQLHREADVILQVGVMFDANWPTAWLPNVIYTDYTSHLSAQKPAAGRSPLSASQQQTWFNLEKRTYQQAAHICTRSQMARQSIITEYDIASQKVTAVGGGVNFDSLPQIDTSKENSSPTALLIGKDFYRKGGDLLLEAFAKVRHEIPNARLLLMTRELIPVDYSLQGVELISPTWDRAIINDLYQQADVFVLPARLETWGDVLLEAMAYSLPCIGVWDDAMGEIIDHEQTGLLVQPENVNELAKSMVTILSNPSLQAKYGKMARKRVEKSFTWDKVAEQLASVLQTAASEKTVTKTDRVRRLHDV